MIEWLISTQKGITILSGPRLQDHFWSLIR